MTHKFHLSGLVVAHNEEDVIEDALKSLSFCDEIVVCLDRCSDGTKVIAEKYADTVLEGGLAEGWESEGKRRNSGIEACEGKWIFELDADERATPELAASIGHITHTVTEEGTYLVGVDNYIGDRLVRYGWAGSFGTTAVARLFTKGSKQWGDQKVHPTVEMGKKLGRVEGQIVHLVDKDIDDMIDRLQRYTTARAADMAAFGNLPPFRTTLRKGFTRFYKSYWGRKGYKEGRMGFLLALMAFLFMVLSHIKAEKDILEPVKEKIS